MALSISKTGALGGTENTHVPVLSFLHPSKVMLRAAVSSKIIIWLFFRCQMATSEFYLYILRGLFVEVQNVFDDHWNTSLSLQDYSRPHRAAEDLYFLCEHFDDRVIDLDYSNHSGSSTDWPPYSLNLIPCDIIKCSGRYLNNQVYCQIRKRLQN